MLLRKSFRTTTTLSYKLLSLRTLAAPPLLHADSRCPIPKRAWPPYRLSSALLYRTRTMRSQHVKRRVMHWQCQASLSIKSPSKRFRTTSITCLPIVGALASRIHQTLPATFRSPRATTVFPPSPLSRYSLLPDQSKHTAGGRQIDVLLLSNGFGQYCRTYFMARFRDLWYGDLGRASYPRRNPEHFLSRWLFRWRFLACNASGLPLGRSAHRRIL